MAENVSDLEIILTMATFGGSFARALAQAAMTADPVNLRRLRDAFPEMWAQYAEVARLKQREGADRC